MPRRRDGRSAMAPVERPEPVSEPCLQEARMTEPNTTRRHRPVTAPTLPAPAGPYSPAVALDRLVFVSGQGAKDPRTGQLAGPDVETQTEQCLRNVQAILEAAGSSLGQVLRCGVFLVDMEEFSKMNAVYSRVFGDHRPARTTIQAAGLPGPGMRVEIDAIAYIA
jgi:2-iminobutanoate/2-iminopropanoate deaminase